MSKFYATHRSYAELRISRRALLPLSWNGHSYIWRTRKHEKIKTFFFCVKAARLSLNK